MRSILSTALLIFFAFLLAYLALELIPSDYLGGVDRVRIVSGVLGDVAKEAWDFARPILQLVVILLILQAILDKIGIKFNVTQFNMNWEIRSLIAIIVVVAFVIAALGGVPGLSSLKDVTLVVVGFYFGGLIRQDGTEKPKSGTKTPLQ